eukprot:TRINITY_DN4908_c0_g1_i1.p1 TRINITY_DN4908_c0_g1~~TRINITY_DN4908_c0_g1_i1.p1  ORF type:complete len:317 (-),score=59.66 TRINITY_DN4908_c0_g1_i1:6-956(-)
MVCIALRPSKSFLQNAAALSVAFNKTFGVYIEMKTPSYFASIGLPMEDKLLAALATSTIYGPAVCSVSANWCPVFIQCFESTALTNLKVKFYPRIQLLGSPTDIQADTGRPYSELMSSKGLAAISKYAVGIGPDKSSLVGTSLLRDAHDRQLLVHPWTFRENTSSSSPNDLDSLRAELEHFYRMGVDGVFTDLPDVALEVRQSVYYPTPTGLGWRLPMVCFFLGFLLSLGMITAIAECSKVKLYSVTVNPSASSSSSLSVVGSSSSSSSLSSNTSHHNNNQTHSTDSDDSPTSSSSSSSTSSKRDEERSLIAADEV